MRLWNYVTHDTINQDPYTVVLNWTDSEHEVVDCDADADWNVTNFDSLDVDLSDNQEGTGSIKAYTTTIEAATRYTVTYDPTGTWNWFDQNAMHFWIKWDTTNGTVPMVTRFRLIDGSGCEKVWFLSAVADLSWVQECKSFNDGEMLVGTELDFSDIDSIQFEWETSATVNENDDLTLWVDYVHNIEGVRGGTAGEYDFPKEKIYSIKISMVPNDYEDGNRTPLASREPFNVTVSNYQMPGESPPILTTMAEKLYVGTSTDFDSLFWLTPARVVEELARRGYKYIYHYLGSAWKFMELKSNGDLDLTVPVNEAFEMWHKAFFEELDANEMDLILALSLEHNSLDPHEGLFQRDYQGYAGWSECVPTSAFVSPVNETAREYYRAVYGNITSWAYVLFDSDTKMVSAENWYWHQGWRRSVLTADAIAGQNVVSVENATGFSARDRIYIRAWTGQEAVEIKAVVGNQITLVDDLTQTYQVCNYADIFCFNYDDRPFIYDGAMKSRYLAEEGTTIEVFTSISDSYDSGNAANTVNWCNDKLNEYILNMSTHTKFTSVTAQFGILTDPGYMPDGLMSGLNDLECYRDGTSLDFIMIEDYSAVMGKNWSQVDQDMAWVNYTSWYYLTGIVHQTAEANEPVFDAIIKAYQNEAEMVYFWSWHQQRNYGIDFLEWNAVIGCELLNGKVDGTWVFTETNYYLFDSLYQNLDGWEVIHECYIGFSDGVHWISAKYDVQDQAFTLLTGGEYVKLKAGTVENDTASDLSVIFRFYFEATLLDAQDIDVYMMATQVDGIASEWSIVEENLFNLINNPQTRPKKVR